MAKVFFKLPGYYEGIRARRIKQSGRLWLVRVISDPDKESGNGTFRPYWFVLIKGFDPIKDKVSGATSIGVWRFAYEDEALAKFEKLAPLYPEKPLTPKQIATRLAIQAHKRPKIARIIPAIPLFQGSGAGQGTGGTMIPTDGVGPPGPEMRSPGGKPGQREMSISEPTVDIYASDSQLSSDLLRLTSTALSVDELSEWGTCRHVTSRRESTCHY